MIKYHYRHHVAHIWQDGEEWLARMKTPLKPIVIAADTEDALIEKIRRLIDAMMIVT
jgi:truncated hemoglobin YjbI